MVFLHPDLNPYESSPGSGSVTNFFTSWIRVRMKMIRIGQTGIVADPYHFDTFPDQGC